MKVKASWAAFLPVMLGAFFLHLYYMFFIGGGEITQQLFGDYFLLINEQTEPEIIVALCAVLFVFSLFFFLIDRKTAPGCDIKGSALSGIFLVVAALLLGVDSAVSIMGSIGTDAFSTDIVVKEVFSIFVALILAIVGMGLLVGYNMAKKIRFLMLMPTVWGVIGMISAFISHRKEASSFAFFDVFAWVFLTLFLFNSAMVLSGIEIKNPVKSSFLFGLTSVVFSFVYVISSIHESINEVGYFDFTTVIPQLTMGALALYTLFFLMKLSSSMVTKKKAAQLNGEEVALDDDSDDEEDVPEAAFGVGSTKYVTAEFEKIRLEKAAQKAKERTGSIPNVKSDDDEEEEREEPVSTLDKIDQLIMELSEEDDKK